MQIITSKKKWSLFDFKEVWQQRDLIYFFAWRNLKLRYKQTVLGVLWVIFQPLITMVIFSLFFGKFAKIPSDGLPYPLFVFIGLILWNYFSFSLSHASESMVENEEIIKKIYFPRLIIPIASSLVGLIDFFISFLIFIVLMFYYDCVFNFSSFVFMPLFVFVVFFASIGLGSFLAAINVKYRDVKYVLPFFIQLLLFLTPVIYPSSILNGKYKTLLYLNPMSGIIENARGVFLGTGLNFESLLFSFIGAAILFIFGIFYFKKTENYFADVI